MRKVAKTTTIVWASYVSEPYVVQLPSDRGDVARAVVATKCLQRISILLHPDRRIFTVLKRRRFRAKLVPHNAEDAYRILRLLKPGWLALAP